MVLYRSYEDGPVCQLAVALMIFFPFDRPDRLLPEQPLWKFGPEQLGAQAILDMGLPNRKAKSRSRPNASPER
jgi:hypothetical protein